MKPSRKTIDQAWKKIQNHGHWGDRLDVRYYLIQRIHADHPTGVDCIVDVSSHAGVMLQLARARKKIGIEYDAELIDIGRRAFPELQFIQSSSEQLPFPIESQSADVVTLCNSIPGWCYTLDSYKTHQDGALARSNLFNEIERILKPGGSLYITGSNKNHPAFTDYSLDLPTTDRVLSLLQSFSITEVKGWNPLPTLANILPRRWLKKFPKWGNQLSRLPPVLFYSKVPGVWRLLTILSGQKKLIGTSRHFFIKAKK